jgi:hypothetical protein
MWRFATRVATYLVLLYAPRAGQTTPAGEGGFVAGSLPLGAKASLPLPGLFGGPILRVTSKSRTMIAARVARQALRSLPGKRQPLHFHIRRIYFMNEEQ